MTAEMAMVKVADRERERGGRDIETERNWSCLHLSALKWGFVML